MNKIITATLDNIRMGHNAIIEKVTAPRELESRLLSLGFTKGNHIRLVDKSSTKETIIVNIENTKHALRDTEAKHILIMQNIEY